jgi:hypothetical protein
LSRASAMAAVSARVSSSIRRVCGAASPANGSLRRRSLPRE